MSDRNGSADIAPLVSRSAAQEQIRRCLRMFIGRGKRYSVKEASNGSGVPDRVIECAIAPDGSTDYREPPYHVVESLKSFIGPELSSALMSPIGQGAYWLPDGDGDDLHALARDGAEFNHEFLAATDPTSPGGADVIPLEREKLKTIARRMGPRAGAVAA